MSTDGQLNVLESQEPVLPTLLTSRVSSVAATNNKSPASVTKQATRGGQSFGTRSHVSKTSLPGGQSFKIDRRAGPTLGILQLEGSQAQHLELSVLSGLGGDASPVGHQCQSLKYPLVYRTVHGLTSSMCYGAPMSAEIVYELVHALNYLEEQNVAMIIGGCSSFVLIEDLVRRHTSLPLMMSPLVMLPSIDCIARCTRGSPGKTAVFTADAESLKQLSPEIKGVDGIDLDNYIIVDCKLELAGLGDSLLWESVYQKLTAAAKKTLAEHDDIQAILLESMQLLSFSGALRSTTGLPVYDAVSYGDLLMCGTSGSLAQ